MYIHEYLAFGGLRRAEGKKNQKIIKHWECYVELKKKELISFWKKHDYYKDIHFEAR
jgi:hypothetical protein